MVRNTISKLLPRGAFDHLIAPPTAPGEEVDWSIYTWGLNGVDNDENNLLR